MHKESITAAVGDTVMPAPGELLANDLADLVQCPICFCRLDASADPRALPCLHTFCRTCLQKYKDCHHNSHKLTRLPCPFCRRECPMPAGGIDGLPQNFITCRISDAIWRHAISRGEPVNILKQRPQPSAPSLPEMTQPKEPSAPTLDAVVDSGNSRRRTNSGGSTTGPSGVQMRSHAGRDTQRGTRPRPKSDPSSPTTIGTRPLGIYGRNKNTNLNDSFEEDNDTVIRPTRRKPATNLMASLIGSFFVATSR